MAVAAPPSRQIPGPAPPVGRVRTYAPAGIALGAAVALAATLRLWGLGRQGFWYDEAITSWLVRDSPAELLRALPRTESTPPLYYLVAWAWTHLFGDTQTGLRSLSAVAGIATVPVAFAAGRVLAGVRVGLVAALLVAVNPLLVWYSQEARSYALLAFACALTFWLYARARSAPSATRLGLWAVASALALSTHYFAAFVVAPEALLLLAARRPALRWRLLAVGLVAGAAGALAGLAWTQRAHANWIGTVPLRTRLGEIPRQLAVGFTPPATVPAVAVAGAVVLAAVLLLALRANSVERRAAALAGTVAVAAVGVPCLLALAGVDYLNTRNVIGALVPAALVVAAGLGARRAGIAGLAGAVALAAVSLALVAAVVHDPAAQRARWQDVAAALGPRHGPRAIMLDGTSTWALPLAIHLPHTWWVGRGGARVTEIDVIRRLPGKRSCSGRTWWGASCDLGVRPKLPSTPARGFRPLGTRDVAGFAIDRYRSAVPIRVYPHPPLRNPRQPGPKSRRRHLLVTPAATPAIP